MTTSEADATGRGGRAWDGQRFVLLLFAAILGLTGVFGFVIGLIRPESLDPELFMLVQLPPTPLGVAVYGVLTVGTVLGALLLLVRYVGRRYDTDRRE